MLPIHVIIPAAGSGSRMGASLPKLLLELAGAPIIVRTLRSVLQLKNIAQIIVTAPKEYVSTYRELLTPESGLITVVCGGKTRQESVRIALAEISRKIIHPEKELVLIHDGARCFVTKKILEDAVMGGEKYKAVTVAVPVIDSIKRVNNDGVAIESLQRSELWIIQTPQVFTFSLINNAHHSNESIATDDASLVEKFHPVYMVEGDRCNIKVTTPFDLKIAKALLE